MNAQAYNYYVPKLCYTGVPLSSIYIWILDAELIEKVSTNKLRWVWFPSPHVKTFPVNLIVSKVESPQCKNDISLDPALAS